MIKELFLCGYHLSVLFVCKSDICMYACKYVCMLVDIYVGTNVWWDSDQLTHTKSRPFSCHRLPFITAHLFPSLMQTNRHSESIIPMTMLEILH